MKILIISQHIFPIQTPRAHRTTELMKELSRQGHEVIVYAVIGKHSYKDFQEQYNIKIHNISFKTQIHPYNSDGNNKRHLIDKITGKLLGKIFEFPYIEFLYSIPKIIKKENNIDLLISIADPHHIHWGCAKAKKKYPDLFPKKWVADCGDPFMNNGNTTEHLQYYAKYERLFSKSCDFITVPIPGAKKGYYPEYRDKIKVIPQGFEFNNNSSEVQEPKNKVPTFAYAGTFLKDIRNPSQFLDFLLTLEIDFKFYVFTQFDELIAPYKNKFGNKLEVRGLVSRKELLDFIKDMDFLVNIENLNNTTQVPSKLIDYAIIQRPILSISPDKPDQKTIEEFLNKNYSNQFIIENIEQYHISNVVKSFLELAH